MAAVGKLVEVQVDTGLVGLVKDNTLASILFSKLSLLFDRGRISARLKVMCISRLCSWTSVLCVHNATRCD